MTTTQKTTFHVKCDGPNQYCACIFAGENDLKSVNEELLFSKMSRYGWSKKESFDGVISDLCQSCTAEIEKIRD